MSEKIKVAIIRADPASPIEFKEIEGNLLDEYQAIVGGLIEAVRIPENQFTPAMDYYVNEDGLGLQLPFNVRATVLYEVGFRTRGYIVGDAVVIGGVDSEGEDIGLNERQEYFLQNFGIIEEDDSDEES
jgi:hypothetical protein